MKNPLYIITLLIGTSLTANAWAETQTWSCGENCTATLSDNGVMTVSGSGSMDDYTTDTIPWKDSLESITNVVVQSGITNLGVRSFQGATNLVSASLPEGLTSIGNGAFNKASSLTTINIPSTVTTIGNGAFQYASSLQSINLPDGLTSIGTHAFNHAESLTSLVIPETVTSIGRTAFQGTTSLESINIPSGITEIGDYMFYGAENLKNLILPDGITSIGYASFYNANSLESINIPSSVESIGDFAFKYAYSLTDIEFQEGLKTIGDSAFEATSLGRVELPDSIISIGDYAFGQAYAYNDILTNRIDTIILGENLQEIGNVAFSRNTATTIILPESLFADGRELNPYAFEYSKISTMYCPAGNEQCLSFTPLHCNGDIDEDGTCLGEIVPSAIQLTISTYTITPNGTYILDGMKYASFADMQKNENGKALRRIYTVDEAERASKKRGNVLKLRYK